MNDRLSCINCGGSVSLGDPELCPTCLWLTRGQLIDCVQAFSRLLRRHAEFDRWCQEHGAAA